MPLPEGFELDTAPVLTKSKVLVPEGFELDAPSTTVDFSLGGKTVGSQQDVMGIATPRQRVEAQGMASDIVNSVTTLPATVAAGVQRGVGSLQTSLGYAPETQNLQPEYNADLGGYVEVDQTYSPFRSDPALMKQGMANMTEADLVKAQIDKEKPVIGILGKAVREGGFQVGNMGVTLPLALVPGIGPDLALGAMSMASGADAIKKGKEIGLTDTEIADYRGKTELPEYLGEKANFGTFMATLSGKNPFVKQVLKLAGTEFLSEAGTSHFQFAADKAYEKPGLTKEAREAIYNGIISGKSLSEDPALLKEYVAMQKETAVAVAGMTGITGGAGKIHRAATGILSNAAQQTDITTGAEFVPQDLPPVNPARTELQNKLATIMGGETDETAAARLAEIQAKKDKQTEKETAAAEPVADAGKTITPEPVKPSPEVEAQAKNIQTFIDRIGETTDPALQEVVTKAKESLKALQPAEAKAETPKLDTAPTADMYSGLGNMSTQGQQNQGKGDFIPVPGEDGRGGFKPIAKKEKPATPNISEAGPNITALPKLQMSNIANHVGRLGSAEAVNKFYAKHPADDPRRVHAEAVAAELYPGGKADDLSTVQQEAVEPEKVSPVRVPNEVKGHVGKSGKAFTAKGTEIEFDYAVMEADDLVASHTADGSTNASYPQEIQPRNREKGTSQLQIKQISQKLRAPQLGENAKVSSGSPFVGPDGVVESGNSRTLGIGLAYDNNQAGEYRAWLHTVAKQYGIKESDVAKMKKPVFVRVRKTEVDRAEFAREANQAGMASMSPAELAKADAARLSDNDFAILNVGEDGNLLAASNREFVKSFLSKLGASEAAGLTDDAGRPTRQAADRMQAAIFANAYGDSKLISMAAEEADVDIKNIIGAMNAAAPTFSKIEDRSVVKTLTDAVGLVREAKSRSLTVADFLDQQDMFNARDEGAEALARKIDASKRSGKKLTELFKSLADTTKQNEEFASQDNLFGDKPKDAAEIAKAVTKEEPKAKGADNKVFTEDAYLKAKAILKAKLDNQLNSGFDPELMQAGISVAGYHLEAGARKFAAFAKAMIEDLGGNIKPYLKSFYNGVRDLPGVDFTKEMDDYGTVSGYDLDKEDTPVKESTTQVETKSERVAPKGSTEESFRERFKDKPWMFAPGVFEEETGEFTKSEDLTPEGQAVEDDLFKRLVEDPEKMMQEYLNIAHTVDGKPGNRTMLEIMETGPVTINPDEGRALSREYDLNPAKYTGATHEPVSALAKMVGAQALTIADPRGINRVLVLGGGGGSGKGSAMKATDELSEIEANTQIIFDGTMAKAKNFIKIIGDSSRNGKSVVAVHVHRDIEGAVSGIVGRKWGGSIILDGKVVTGRDVPIHAAAEAHFLSGGVFLEIAEMYKGEEYVDFRVVANVTGTKKSLEINLDKFKQLLHAKIAGRTYQDFKPYVASLYAKYEADPEFNPYIEGGEHYGRLETRSGRIERLDASPSSSPGTGSSEQSSSGQDNQSNVRQPGQERREQSPDDVTPETWWDNQLTKSGREKILDGIGSTVKPGIKWRYVTKAEKEIILAERGGELDAIAAEGVTNVSSPSNENTGNGSEPTAAVTPGDDATALDAGPSDDVAGVGPDAVQESVQPGIDNTAPAATDGTDVTGDGSGSGPSVSAPGPTRTYADVPSPAHVVGGARNFTITNELDFDGIGNVTKLRNNIAAIKLVKQINSELRPATPEEQSALARYVGFGGLANAFDAKKSKEYSAELKEILTPEEYDAARASTRNAHYTSPVIVNGMWDAVQRLGFDRGAVLESSMGTGNFFGLMPRGLRSMSKMTGIELDPMTASIAKLLYPQAKVHNKGFQEVKITAGSFDLAIGNPPFAADGVFDPDPDNKAFAKFNLHGYFFAKSVKSLRPGGVLAMVVSNSLMDSKSGIKQRQWLASQANLLGAIRLPNNAFKSNAGTEVTTDIIFLQKLEPGQAGNVQDWDELGTTTDKATGADIPINKYFIDNPDMMLGEMNLTGSMYRGGTPALTARPGDNLAELLQAAIQKLPQGVMTAVKDTAELNETARGPLKNAGTVRPFGMFMEDGKIYQRMADQNGDITARPVDATGKTADRIASMIELRDTVRRQLLLESGETTSDDAIEQNRKRLGVLYNAFVKANGHLNNDTNKRLFWEDADSPLLRSLEREYDKGLSKDLAKKRGEEAREPSAKKADIFTKRVLSPTVVVSAVENAADALSASMSERGRVDLDYMRGIYSKSEQEIISELGDTVYEDPNSGWQVAAQYLSGNVKAKLAEAIISAKGDSKYNRNIEALDRVQPSDIPAANIYVAPHSFWVPRSVFEQFAAEIFKGTMTGGYSKPSARWDVRFTSSDSIANSSTYGTRRMDGTTIMQLLMANKQIVVKDSGATKDDPPVINKDETAAAQGKADELVDLFQEWIWKNQERRQSVVRLYNDTMNTTVKAKHDGSHLTMPGTTFPYRPHQKNVINRGIQSGVVLYDHVVGSGKTAIMVGTIMELKRLGLARKPMMTVPNHLVEQTAASFAKIYPNAKVLAATKKDFKGDNRRALFAKIATGDWDVVIIAHSSFKFIPVPRDTQVEILNEQMQEYIEAVEEAKRQKDGGTLSVKRLEQARDKIKARLQALADMPKDSAIDFQEMGVDALFVDEAHEFKNLFYATGMQNVAGLGSPSGSGRAFDMFVKTQYLMRRNGGKGVFFATGTPVSNSLAEVYHMQRFLQYDELKARGINNFDAWASAFGRVTTDWEQDAGGRFKQKTRFRSLVNLPELKQLWGTVADTVTNSEIIADAKARNKPFNLPHIEGGKPKNVIADRSPQQAAYIGVPTESLDDNGDVVYNTETGLPVMEYAPGTIVYRMDNWMAEQKAGNTREMPLVITGDARKAGLDFRLIEESAPDWAGSKTNTAVKEIIEIHKANDYRKGTQLVFCDLSTPQSAKGKTMEKLAETTPTYFIRVVGGDGVYDTGVVHVAGKPVSIKAAAAGTEFFYTSKGTGAKRVVTIYERSSGLPFTAGDTVKAAKDKAEMRAAQEGDSSYKGREIADEQIDEYIASWEEAQSEAEDTTEEGESPAAAVSFDDILADSGKSDFSVYDDMRAKLIAGGIPADQIAFIHDYNTDAQKAELFAKVNNGIVRVLMGSTQKMGAGTNVQKRLVALHHMDAPWKPSDLAQREGRIVRQGNLFWNPESDLHDPDFLVKIRRYATKQTYDSRMWEINEIKALSIELFRTGGEDVREVEDVSSESANAAEIKASSSGNPLMLEDLKLRKEVQRLGGMEKSWTRGRYDLEDKVESFKRGSTWAQKQLKTYQGLQGTVSPKTPDSLGLKIGKETFNGFDKETPEERAELTQKIGTHIKGEYVAANKSQEIVDIGTYRGMTIKVSGWNESVMMLVAHAPNGYKLGTTDYKADDKFTLPGLITRLDNLADSIERNIASYTQAVAKESKESEAAAEELKQPFKHAAALKEAKDQHKKVIEALRQGKTSLDAVGEAEGNPYKELGEMQTVYPESGSFEATAPYEGLILDSMGLQQIYERLAGAKIVKDAMSDLRTLGAHIYAKGQTTWKEWFAGMKEALGKLFGKYRGPLESVYKFTVNKMAEDRGSLGAMFKGKNLSTVPAVASVDPEIEKRWQDSKGLGSTTLSLKENIGKFVDDVLAETQHFSKLDLSDRVGKRTSNILRVFESTGAAAKAKTVSHLQGLVKDFDNDQMDIFTRAVILGDLMNEAAKGHKLPFGYDPITLITDYQNVTAAVNQDPKIQAALERRKEVNKEMVLQLVDAGLLPVESVLKESAKAHYQQTGKYDETDINTDYYRHQVLAKSAAKAWVGVSTAGEVRNKKRGWMKERQGSELDINTNFLEAEFEWFSQSMKELATKKTLDEVVKLNDIAAELKAEAEANDIEDWKTLIPEDHVAWQPVKGSVFYRGQTMTEAAVAKFIESNPAFADVADMFRDATILGGKKYEAIIPIGLAETLDNLRVDREDALLDTVNKKLIGAWKVNTLLNPHRVIKYNINNMSGDMDAAMAADPAILKYMWQAFRNAVARKNGRALTPMEIDMIDRGVIDAGISINEIPDISKLPGFKNVSETSRNTRVWESMKSGNLTAILPPNLIAQYFDFVSGWTQVREGILRESAYMRAMDLMRQGKTIYWASDAMEINSLPDMKDKAAKLSRELLGDYGNLSAHGEKLRTRFIPFWSWMEINSPRYYRIFKNAAMRGEGGSNAARIAGVGGRKVIGGALGIAEKALLVQALFALVSMFNRFVWPEEEEALGENGRKQLHLILGKTSDGKVLTVKFQGAFSDVLGWMGLEDYPSMVRRYAEGKMDKSDVWEKMWHAPFNKMANASVPFVKLAGELITQKSIYPDITRPVPVRDRKEHIARFFSFDEEYRALAGKPSKGYAEGFKKSLIYESDPGEQAYNTIRQLSYKYQEKYGKEKPATTPSDQANALYYYRQAVRYKDETAKKKYMQLYLDNGGKRSGLSESINRAAPLASLPTNLKYKFRSSLSAADQETLKKANEWYREVYKK